MLEIPKWAKSLPSSLQLNKEQFKMLENLRVEHNISHDDFLSAVLASPISTLKILRNVYQELKNVYPGKEEKQILRLVITNRYFEKTEDEIDMIMNKISSFSSLCTYVVKQDKLESPHYENNIAGKLIKILSIDFENRNNDISKEAWDKAELIYPYSYIFSSFEKSPTEFEKKINTAVLSTESYNMKSFEKIWELINLSDDKILGINWDEGKSVMRNEIEKKIINIGFKIKPMRDSMSIKFNQEFIFGDIIEGSITLMKDGMFYCAFHFVYRNAEGLINFLEQKYGKSLNLRDDMIREFKYDWMIGDIALLVEMSKVSKFVSMGFKKDVDFGKLHRGEIDITDFTKKYDEKNKLNQ